MASWTSRSCAERRLTLIALNARATVAASAVPRTGSCSERLPAAISAAAEAMSRNGRLKWRLRNTPPTSDSARAATPASAKRTRSVSMNCWVSAQSDSTSSRPASPPGRSGISGNTPATYCRPPMRRMSDFRPGAAIVTSRMASTSRPASLARLVATTTPLTTSATSQRASRASSAAMSSVRR